MESKAPKLFYEVSLAVGRKSAFMPEIVYCQFNHSGPDSAGPAYIVAFPVRLRRPVFRRDVAGKENENDDDYGVPRN
jgi:hypothetical protein